MCDAVKCLNHVIIVDLNGYQFKSVTDNNIASFYYVK